MAAAPTPRCPPSPGPLAMATALAVLLTGCSGRTGFEVGPWSSDPGTPPGDPGAPGDAVPSGDPLPPGDAVVEACAALGCHPDATCVADVTGVQCQCNAGFTGDGFSCADVSPPMLTGAVLNGGDTYTRIAYLSLAVSVTDPTPPISVRVAAANASGDCQASYVDASWQPYSDPATSYSRILLPVDGEKKLCAWARDGAGNVSVIAPPTGNPGIDSDTIILSAAHIPLIEAFSVVNDVAGPRFGGRIHNAGDALRITWRVADAEGLANSPIELYYTTAAVAAESWQPIAVGYGSLTGNPTTYDGTYTAFTAPDTSPFRVKIVAVDMAGNRSIAGVSDLQNTPSWSVYAGSVDRGTGGVARSAALHKNSNVVPMVDVDPRTGTVIAVDEGYGMVAVDVRTGLVSRLMRDGNLNLPADGPLPAVPTFPAWAASRFGPDGKLYVGPGAYSLSYTASGVIYQVDLATNTARAYVGGGTLNDDTATPLTAFAFNYSIGMDDVGSLYFLASCTPGSWTGSSRSRLMKVTQAADGTAGEVSVVAGDCTVGTTPSPGPSDPLSVPLGLTSAIGSIAAWNQGRTIYFGYYNIGVWKILDGQLYASNVSTSNTGSIAYNPANGMLYAADGDIVEYLPNLSGANGDTPVRTLVSAAGTGASCGDDGVAASQACANVHFGMSPLPDGTLLFVDGPGLNGERSYRIRFVDPSGAVRTYFGAPAFHQAGMDRRLVRAAFAGIHYKKATDPNQAAFPAGLYFMDPEGLVLGHVDPSNDQVVVDWGNQSGVGVSHPTGTPIGPDVTLGRAYYGGTAAALAFDSDGLPWTRYGPEPNQSVFVRVDANREVVQIQDGLAVWETASDSANPYNLDLWPFGAWQNLALKGHAAFLIGGYTSNSAVATIKLLDFAGGTVTRLMGVAPDGFSPDVMTPGNVINASLSTYCHGQNPCAVVYRADEDRLYFSEDYRVRYITTPSTPTTSTLTTLWTNPTSASVQNFAFTPDGTQLFYLTGSTLRCHTLSGTPKAWCNDSSLGPPAILGGFSSGPNSLTFKDATTLMMSTQRGEILEYTLAP